MAAALLPALALAADRPPAQGDTAATATVQKLFESFRQNSYKPADDTLLGPPALGWPDIPELLALAPSRRVLTCYPVNPISSRISMEGYSEGIIALWLLEGVRKGGKRYPSLNPICSADARDDYADVQSALLAVYRAWWERVKAMPQDEGAAIDPLAGTGLHWR